jgi:glycosyltransferase involved in cell wall biosynthesis
VHFLGALPQERIRYFYRHAIAVLVPSICYEVFGLIVVEAYQQRTPVIAHALGGLTELVEQSQGGFLYHEPDELLAAMERLRTDPALRREMGDRGYQMYGERWGESAHLETYFGLLEETARRKLGSVPWHQQARLAWRFSTVGRA